MRTLFFVIIVLPLLGFCALSALGGEHHHVAGDQLWVKEYGDYVGKCQSSDKVLICVRSQAVWFAPTILRTGGSAKFPSLPSSMAQ